MEGKVIISHFFHEHPLILTENVGNKEMLNCYGCHKPVISESGYVCSQQYCSSTKTSILHKKCAELPRQIFHLSHPQHPLHLYYNQRRGYRCDLCSDQFGNVLRYRCSSCDFDIDTTCEKLTNINKLFEKIRTLQHPSHRHPLTLLRKPAFSFHCHGCNIEDQDMAYICSTCDMWIHKTCASLPMIIKTNHHHHQISLSFYFPIQHRKFDYYCVICLRGFHRTYWLYYCGDCRYFAHVKCVIFVATRKIVPAESNLNTEKNNGSDLIEFPVHDISKELIAPFIIRENGHNKIPDIKDMPASLTMPATAATISLSFNYHKHPLILVSEGSVDDELVMICDVCVTPIHSPPYYNCATCNKYFLHSTCYLLPETLCLDPHLYENCRRTHQNHKLFSPYARSKLDNNLAILCKLCQRLSNGMFYGCEDCALTIDVKCASLPTTIKHASHQQHELIMRKTGEIEPYRICDFCECGLSLNPLAYYCTGNNCDFALDLLCVLLPRSIKHEWDKHLLLLTNDASIDHPTDFYCEVCEEEMHPKKWMYHCRECDHSFHRKCLAASDWFRNIKFGQEIEFDNRLHPHPLAYNLVTLKLRCDTCHKNCYKWAGFECGSCNYVMCQGCGVKAFGNIFHSAIAEVFRARFSL